MKAPLIILLLLTAVTAPAVADTYSENEILGKIEGFFGAGAQQIGEVVRKIFKEQGEPNAYIAGEEAGAAIVVGLRYGRGDLHLKEGGGQKVYWQGPSLGLDFGADAAKVFILVYHLPKADALFQRFPGVEGSLYYVGGVGANYLRSDDIVLAPVRFGGGWRQGISAGYMDFTREAKINPF